MKTLRVAILAIGLLLATSAFADTYQFTVTYNGVGGLGAGTLVFTTNSLSPNGVIPLNQVTVSGVTPGMFLAQLQLLAPSPSSEAAVSAVFDLNSNSGAFINEILYNNGTFNLGTFSFSPWNLGSQNVSGNYGSDFCCGGQGTNFGTVNVEDVTTPEPGSLALLGSGLIGLAGVVRRKLVR